MAEYKTYCCKHCKHSFEGRIRDRKKGLALFCSKACANEGNKSRGVFFDKVCRNCSKDFDANSIMAKFCSSKCRVSYSSRLRRVDRRKGDFKKIALLACELCGYARSNRDVHHITPVSEGGSNDILNLISLCPNCHRECHELHFSRSYLKGIVKRRFLNLSFS